MLLTSFPNRIIFQKTRELILFLGGYWPPLSALARLTEELGELIEEFRQIQFSDSVSESLCKEIADVYFITTTLAQNYCIEIPDHEVEVNLDMENIRLEDILFNTFSLAGEIARVINGYEGPKTFRPGKIITPLYVLIPNLLVELRILAFVLKIDLAASILASIETNQKLDKGRFPKCFDPSASVLIDVFRKNETAIPEISGITGIWGGIPFENTLSQATNIRLNVIHIQRFIKISSFEKINTFVLDIGEGVIDKQVIEEILDQLQGTLTEDNWSFAIHKSPVGQLSAQYELRIGARDFMVFHVRPADLNSHNLLILKSI